MAGSFATITGLSIDPATPSSAAPSTFLTSITLTPTSTASATPSVEKSGFRPENLSTAVQIGILVAVILFGIGGMIAAFIVFSKPDIPPRIEQETSQIRSRNPTAERLREEDYDRYLSSRQDPSWFHSPYWF